MSRKASETESSAHAPSLSKKSYTDSLRKLQIERVKLQRHLIKCDDTILIILEGRDASGKDGTIKRIVQHLSPRESRVVALGKRSDRDRVSWYFQRYVPYLPAAQELVLFNRSWYNRAGVEGSWASGPRPSMRSSWARSRTSRKCWSARGVKLLKYSLGISKAEQKRRLQDRNEMLAHTHSPMAPWTLVRAKDKRLGRLNIIKELLAAGFTTQSSAPTSARLRWKATRMSG